TASAGKPWHGMMEKSVPHQGESHAHSIRGCPSRWTANTRGAEQKNEDKHEREGVLMESENIIHYWHAVELLQPQSAPKIRNRSSAYGAFLHDTPSPR
ncbi:hypothetical protein AAIH24_31285, partial [Pseudomonas aeruginosa]|uniref:hypothetical protein n=1 Tax=Pseudomonas aeruginosa TaxID=287 RepID=UPI0031B71CE9